MLIVSGFVAAWQQTLAKPNVYITIACIVIFMYGMMRLSARIPSRHQENDHEDEIQ